MKPTPEQKVFLDMIDSMYVEDMPDEDYPEKWGGSIHTKDNGDIDFGGINYGDFYIDIGNDSPYAQQVEKAITDGVLPNYMEDLAIMVNSYNSKPAKKQTKAFDMKPTPEQQKILDMIADSFIEDYEESEERYGSAPWGGSFHTVDGGDVDFGGMNEGDITVDIGNDSPQAQAVYKAWQDDNLFQYAEDIIKMAKQYGKNYGTKTAKASTRQEALKDRGFTPEEIDLFYKKLEKEEKKNNSYTIEQFMKEEGIDPQARKPKTKAFDIQSDDVVSPVDLKDAFDILDNADPDADMDEIQRAKELVERAQREVVYMHVLIGDDIKRTEGIRVNQNFIAGYLEAMLWSSVDDSPERGEFLDQNFGIGDIAPESIKQAEEDCAKFLSLAGDMLKGIAGYDMVQAGHDLWLTRNGHGAGFWDRKELEKDGIGDKLSDIASKMGEKSPYVGDDGKIYLE